MDGKKLIKQSLSDTLYDKLISETLVPIILMIITTNVALILPYIVIVKNSNINLLFDSFQTTLAEAWNSVKWNDLECWTLIIGLLLWGLISFYLPGRHYYGPPTDNGYKPEYWNNGFTFYVISMLIAVPVIWNFSVLHFYYKIPTLIGILSVTGHGFCMLLYFKGLLKPDPGICNTTKNPILDYYYGTELYPYLGRFVNLKIFTSFRFAQFLWQLMILIAWKSNYELYIASYNSGVVNWSITATTLLMTFYLAIQFYEEDYYTQTFDYIYERFGYMLAWGNFAFVPAFYTLNCLSLVQNSATDVFGFNSFIVVVGLGVLFILLTYWAGIQRQIARATDGKCIIWGAPAKVIRATYHDDYGKSKRSILLASGFWGTARHMNYTFEFLSYFFSSFPALISSCIPCFHLIFLLILLVHRSIRDDNRCLKKYGIYWMEYCKIVPYKMIPLIF